MASGYFYGQQSEQFSFYRIPKVLFTDERYRGISCEAKTLYGLLLDRMNLSAKNGWLDETGRVYIIFTIEEIMESMGCGNKKAGQMLAELENKAGLIIRKRQGMGKPNLIYVMNFIEPESGGNGHFQKCQNDTSGSVKTTSQEVSKGHGNNTDINNTDKSNTDLFYQAEVSEMRKDGMGKHESYESYFKESLDYEYLIWEHSADREALDGILSLLVDTCCSNRPFIKISGDEKPAEVVKSRFMKLKGEHIRYVLQCLQENTTRIRNVRQYLLATLYNAPDTISTYYQSWVNHDMASGLI
ncbi:MAG: replication initiator protein A [Lachnospiraceae bacterium]|nr:replication initiator protein A [Lachnospiraceae bacterium]